VIVDLSHWLDELFLRVIGEADLVLLLTTLTVPDLRNLGNLWPVLREWQLVQNKMKLVVNRYEKGAGLTLRNLEQVVKDSAYATLPNDPEICLEAINRGVPLVRVAAHSKIWSGVKDLAQKLHRHFEAQEESAVGEARG